MNNTAQILAWCFCLVFLADACQPENDKNPALVGQWQGSAWLVMGKPSGQDASQVAFEFKADGTYTARYGTQGESGVWRTKGEKLYTTAEDKKEKVVKFYQTDSINMKFEMNRAGQPELIELIRK